MSAGTEPSVVEAAVEARFRRLCADLDASVDPAELAAKVCAGLPDGATEEQLVHVGRIVIGVMAILTVIWLPIITVLSDQVCRAIIADIWVAFFQECQQ